MHSIVKRALWPAILPVLILCLVQTGQARLKMLTPEEEAEKAQLQQFSKTTANLPHTMLRLHTVNNFFLSITNWGFFGSQARAFQDFETGLTAPGAEFPAGSNIDYLFQGALWISAIIGLDTLTSTGHDGWQHIAEMYPEDAANGGEIVELTNRPGVVGKSSEDAVSEQDFIAEYADTLTDPQFVTPDPFTGQHTPLGIKIHQKSYAWSYSYAQDFIILDFELENIGHDSLANVYMGIYIDADVYHSSRRGDGFQDDICGFRQTVANPSGAKACGENEVVQDTINIAWIADNDGDPVGGIYDYRSPTAVTGTRVVRSPSPPEECGPTPLDYSFNWWLSQGNASLDWGPQAFPGDRNISGGYGTPDGDAQKYRFMSNGEFDYDEVFSNIDYTDSTGQGAPQGWMPPNRLGANFADGYDTRYLLSFGPFNLGVGGRLPVTMAYVAGDFFHSSTDNLANLPNDPYAFYEKLDFTDLAVNAQWAAWVFDNPGFDTPDPETGQTDGCRGLYYLANCRTDTLIEGVVTCEECDTIWYAGDGIPDYKGPPPPQSPELTLTATPGKVILEWTGIQSELEPDPFSFLNDFEGYRVYMADLNQVSNYALLASWDMVDFRVFKEDTTQAPLSSMRWAYRTFPSTLEQLREQFDDPEFEPLMYTSSSNPFTGPDGQRYYYEVEDWNRGNSYVEDGKEVVNRVQRVETLMQIDTIAGTPDTSYYGSYRFEIEGLLPSQAYYFAVTAFDYGYPQNGLQPLESSPLVNAQLVFPINSADVVETEKLKVSVYPNPYKISADYRGKQYEDPYRFGWSERDRRIHFINLPPEAHIKIFTLDGDLVREFDHFEGGPFSDTDSKASWDLISKNTQAIVSGIYLYSVESDLGLQVGKIVIIK